MGFELYESFSAWTYFWVCGGLAAPLWLQPVVAPGLTKDADRPLAERYALKANVWLGVFGFAGNYWYTHYFYSVLGAERFRRADSFSDESRRRRGRDVESPWRRVAATPRRDGRRPYRPPPRSNKTRLWLHGGFRPASPGPVENRAGRALG